MQNINLILEKYLLLFPEEEKNLINFKFFLENNKSLFDRKNINGHIVSNTLVINKKNEVLTIYHNFLKQFLQPGGHVDETDENIINGAIRELKEETGIKKYKLHNWHTENNIPLLIEPHLIPENIKKNEKKHYHYDFIYIFFSDESEIKLQTEEVSDYKWILIDEILNSKKDTFLYNTLIKAKKLNLI